jgi:hypothetical protein
MQAVDSFVPSLLSIHQQSQPLDAVLDTDRFGTINVLSLLGQTLYEANRGNDERALLLLGTALVALQSKKASFALQGVLAADHLVGTIAGERPLETVFRQVLP